MQGHACRHFLSEALTCLTDKHYSHLNELFPSSEDQNQLIIALDVESLVQVSELSFYITHVYCLSGNPPQ